jgi:sulfoquinovose isomerase
LSIAELLIAEATAGNEWRVPEHFHADWTIDKQYDRDVFRPYGSTIGHWLEWSRLLLQLWVATDKVHAWLPEAAATLFAKAMDEGWDKSRGGFYFTVDWEGRPVDTDRYWWPCTEGIAAAYWLGQHLGTDDYEQAYRLIWSWSAKHLIDPGGHFWRHQLNDALEEISNPWYGCPDLYHAIQATLIPTVPAQSSLAAALAHGARR